MNYLKIYNRIILNRQQNPVSGYTERHHYLPKCLFPEFKNLTIHTWNSVKLTAREHFICHLLLRRIYPEHFGLLQAVVFMSGNKKYTSKTYADIRKEFSEIQSKRMAGSCKSTKGKPVSPETLKKRKETRAKNKENGKIYTRNNKGLPRSDEEKSKALETRRKNAGNGKIHKGKGCPKSEETLAKTKSTREKNITNGKIYKTSKGQKYSEETKEKCKRTREQNRLLKLKKLEGTV